MGALRTDRAARDAAPCGSYCRGADLSYANLSQATLSDVDFGNATLDCANVNGVHFCNTNVTNASLQAVMCPSGSITNQPC